jgi:adenylate kinase
LIIAVTGTPGVGKSTFARLLAKRLGVRLLRLNDWIRRRGIGSPAGDGTLEVDCRQLAREFSRESWGDMVVEGHLSHYLPPRLLSAVVVLRLHPQVLERRLRARGYRGRKLWDNLEAEALDLILVESLERHGEGKVFELDLTHTTAQEAVRRFVEAWRKGKRIRDRVDWLESFVERFRPEPEASRPGALSPRARRS